MSRMVSLKKRVMFLMATTLLTTCAIVMFSMWGYYNLRLSERTKAAYDRLSATVSNQTRNLLIGYLVPEQRSGIALLLDKYAKEEGLLDAKILSVDEALTGFSGCQLGTQGSSCRSDNGHSIAVVAPIKDAQNIYGYFVKVQEFRLASFGEELLGLSIGIITVLFVAFLGLILLIARLMSVDVPRQVDSIAIWVRRRLESGERVPPPKAGFEELSRLSEKIEELLLDHDKAREENAALQKQAAVADFAARVAHDIRSPLTALGVATESLQQVPEETRLLIRSAAARIREIAHDLLEKNRRAADPAKDGKDIVAGVKPRETAPTEASGEEPVEVELLDPLVDAVIAEKQMQFRDRQGLEIIEKFSARSYGLFAKIQAHELKRVLSNLFDNAVEAIDGPGRVEVELRREANYAVLELTDTGRGIPKELLDLIGQKGKSFSKPGGSGLGLYYARAKVESWGGKVDIQSEEGKGTSVAVKLAIQAPPAWFVPELMIVPNSLVVVIDDDASIHQVWQTRFNNLGARDRNVKVIHFSSGEEVLKWYHKPRQAVAETLFLIDYELIGSQVNGLELIQKMGVEKQSILVTSSFDQKHVIKECQRHHVRLIPKGLAGFVPLALTSEP